jgi:hypothetical protein
MANPIPKPSPVLLKNMLSEEEKVKESPLRDSSSEETGIVQKLSSAGEDPFGDEDGAVIKYKVMTWQ